MATLEAAALPHADPKPLCVAAYREWSHRSCVRVSLANWLRAHEVGLSDSPLSFPAVPAGVSFDLYRNRRFIRAFLTCPLPPLFLAIYRPLRTAGTLDSEPTCQLPAAWWELAEEGSCAPTNAGWVARGTTGFLCGVVQCSTTSSLLDHCMSRGVPFILFGPHLLAPWALIPASSVSCQRWVVWVSIEATTTRIMVLLFHLAQTSVPPCL